jgi:curved DNA-binding protein CbpA
VRILTTGIAPTVLIKYAAKQYHPDRNPGREVDVLAKFQAVQAAHEILCDAQLKTKYDQERARLSRANTAFSPPETDPYNFRKPTARPPPSTSQFPPPPRRTQTTRDFTATSNARFTPQNGRNPASATPGVDKFKAFTKAAPQQWDRAKFDDAARADAARGFQSMKGKAFSGQQMPPPPTRPPRAPTAPRTSAFESTAPKDDQQAQGPGFPGMSRTANMRKSGFDPSSPSPGMDEQHAPHRPSAYASYSRGERPQATNAQGYFQEGVGPQSPPLAHKKPAASPLRHVRSESAWDAPKPHRPDFERVSSRYANTPGEKTNLNGGLGRSASVRTSPVEKDWDETDGRAYHGRPHSHHGPPRHRSSSPRPRPKGVPIDYSSSSSDSSEEDKPHFESRPKAQARRPRVHTSSSEQHGYRPFSDDDPALTGQFPSNNYTKVVEEPNGAHHAYPPPNNGPVRRPFSNMTSPESAHPTMNGNALHPDDGTPKYDPLRSFSQPMHSARARTNTQTPAFRCSLSSWQVPSSVMPGLMSSPRWYRMDSIPEEKSSTLRAWLSDPPFLSDFELNREPWKADNVSPHSQRRPPEQRQFADSASNPHSVSEELKSSKFTAADWEGKFGSGDEFLRPNIDTSDRDRRSPTRTNRPRARSTGRVKLNAQDHVQENTPPVPGTNGYSQAANGAQSGSDGEFGQSVNAQEQPKSAAFQPGTFSADDWAAKLNEQKWSTLSSDLNSRRPKSSKTPSKSLPRKQGMNFASAEGNTLPSNNVDVAPEDAMDVDGDSMENIASHVDPEDPLKDSTTVPPTDGLKVNLDDLKQTAPFAPSATGLGDLNDLSNAIPFGSRAAPSVEPALNQTISSTARRLELPKPPKIVNPPAEDRITQEAWETYVRNINSYLHDWNVFNIKMLDHFRTRQDQINVGMRNNWINSVGDGPSIEAFDAGDSSLRAGFTTYMAWLEDDARCRSWWDTANERHRECFETLARVRETVKQRVAGDV